MGIQTSVLTRFTSQISNLSGFSRKETENIDSIELEQAYCAVQQPVVVVEETIKLLVSSENNSLDMEFNSQDSLDVACGGAPDEQLSAAPKEKKTAKRTFISDDKFSCEYYHELVISPVYILKALRQFVTNYYQEKNGLPTTGERLQKKRLTISRLLSESDIIKYWDRFKKIYDEERIRIWDGLFEGLKKYHEILKDRKILCEEVVDLRRQNRDLKRLLANYMDHREIMTPPCTSDQNFINSTPPSYTNSRK